MKPILLELLRCPKTGQRLVLEDSKIQANEINSGWLVSEDLVYRYRIHNGIPRFVPESNYANNFGMQWNYFRQTQLDSYSGQPISADRFWLATNWLPADLKGQWVLDVGCGAGRFAEVALNSGAKVIALDYSSAVDACYSNLRHHENLHVIQGDIYELPFVSGRFPYVYSLGVLQHTPDVSKAFAALPPMLCEGGNLCADFYWKRIQTMLHAKYVFRLFTRGMSQPKLFDLLQKWVPVMLKASQILGSMPLLGRVLKRLIPVANYTGVYPLTSHQLNEWALLDTFDMLAPTYDNPQTVTTVQRWFEKANLKNIHVGHWGHLVGRGTRLKASDS